MRIELIRCEICKKEHDAQYELPFDWITTTQYTSYHLTEEKHFCSKSCLVKWATQEEGENDTEP
jgi:hypothetical protein